MATASVPDTIPRERRVLPIAQLVHSMGTYQNPRTSSGLDDASLDALAADIHARGMDDLPVVQPFRTVDKKTYPPTETITFVVKSGQRRVRALDRHGVLEVECQLEPIRDYSDAGALNAYVDAVRANAQHAQLSTVEQVEAAAYLAEQKMPQSDICNVLNRSKAWVSTMLKAYKAATPELKAAWKDGKIPDEQFKDLATVDAKQQASALQNILDMRAKGERSAARAEAKASAAKAEPKAKKETAIERDMADYDKAAQREIDEWPDADAKTVPSANRPPARVVEEYAKLARGPFSAPRDPYVRGALDMARFVVGEIPDSKFEGAWRRFLDAMSKSLAKASTKAAKKTPKAKAAAPAKAKPAPKGKAKSKAKRK